MNLDTLQIAGRVFKAKHWWTPKRYFYKGNTEYYEVCTRCGVERTEVRGRILCPRALKYK